MFAEHELMRVLCWTQCFWLVFAHQTQRNRSLQCGNEVVNPKSWNAAATTRKFPAKFDSSHSIVVGRPMSSQKENWPFDWVEACAMLVVCVVLKMCCLIKQKKGTWDIFWSCVWICDKIERSVWEGRLNDEFYTSCAGTPEDTERIQKDPMDWLSWSSNVVCGIALHWRVFSGKVILSRRNGSEGVRFDSSEPRHSPARSIVWFIWQFKGARGL